MCRWQVNLLDCFLFSLLLHFILSFHRGHRSCWPLAKIILVSNEIGMKTFTPKIDTYNLSRLFNLISIGIHAYALVVERILPSQIIDILRKNRPTFLAWWTIFVLTSCSFTEKLERWFVIRCYFFIWVKAILQRNIIS